MNNENLARNIIQIYQKYGREWTKLRGDYLYEKIWLDRFLAFMPTHAHVLDLGCGSGQPIAAYLMKKGCQITGVDRSEAMLELAQESFPDQIWINADIRQFQSEQKFDGILAWDSFFHLRPDDQHEMFAQFSAHAKLGAVLMFTSGPSHGEAIGDMFGEPLYHASLDAEEYRALLTRYGFEVVKTIFDDPECTGHSIWLAKKSSHSRL